jgi:regulator of sigma E protease
MIIFLSILAFFIILSVLVLAHEFGHFITAKLTGVKVEEFALGYPPRIFSFKRGDTAYSLNAIPFGGYTKMLGEEDPMYPGSLASKSHAVRFLILVAGSVMNVILPILLFAISFMIPHLEVVEKVQISEVAPDSPAQAAGIQAGDIILKIDNTDITNRGNVNYYIQLNLGREIPVLLQQPDGSEKTVRVTPRWKPPAGQGAIGIIINGINSQNTTASMPFWEAFPQGAIHSWQTIVLYKNGIEQAIVAGSAPELTGPIGIAQLTGEVVQAGFTPLLEFAALISISLGIFNLFPFPGLDGGRIVFVAIEWVRRGKRISPRKEGLIHTIGFLILIALILVISYFDVMRIISGQSLVP